MVNVGVNSFTYKFKKWDRDQKGLYIFRLILNITNSFFLAFSEISLVFSQVVRVLRSTLTFEQMSIVRKMEGLSIHQLLFHETIPPEQSPGLHYFLLIWSGQPAFYVLIGRVKRGNVFLILFLD